MTAGARKRSLGAQKGNSDERSARLQVEHRRVAELAADPQNPRVHTPRQVRQIAKSIESFGFNVPILIDRAGKVIAGHGRLLASQQLGYHSVPTICLDHLTEAQARAFMLADNRLTENSIWDERLLAEILRDLALEVELEFDLEATGFEMAEIDLRIEALSGEQRAKEDLADRIPPLEPGEPVSRVGDLWLIGRHRLLCGNALDKSAYAALMGNARAAMVFADPPYNVPIDGHVSGLGAIRHREFAMASGEMTEAEFVDFLLSAVRLLARYSKDGSLHYICMDWRHLSELLGAGRQAYAQFLNLCVWTKDNAGMGSLYRSQHELILVFRNGRKRHRNNVDLGRFGRNRSNVWAYPGVNSFSRGTEKGNLLELHPTVKPVALVADAILDCTARNDLVVDPFLGSGTTLMAAERTGRRCCGIELDPLYVDTIIRRYEAYTGDPVRHAITSQTFQKCAAERRDRGSNDRNALGTSAGAPHSELAGTGM